MTEQELLDAGYSTYPPNRAMGDMWRIAYQKGIRHPDGRRRYFIDVRAYEWKGEVAFSVLLAATRGSRIFSPKAHMRIEIEGDIDLWSIPEMERVVESIFNRLETVDYESAECQA